jgi:hypothetical protein
MGSVEPTKGLHAIWGDRVRFVDVLIRQAHPGPGAAPYESFEQKMRDAQRYQREDSIAWPVLVDDLVGTVHQVYGGLADPTYLIDADGRVAFYIMWTYVPAVYAAIEKLLEQGSRGVVFSGWNRLPHMGPAMTDGWRGLERGLPQSYTDLTRAAPGIASLIWLGYQFRPLLAPLTLRTKPLSTPVSAALAAGALAVLAVVARRALR